LKAVAKIEAEDSPARLEQFFFCNNSEPGTFGTGCQFINGQTVCKLNVKAGGNGQRTGSFLDLRQGKFLPMSSRIRWNEDWGNF